MARCIGLMSGTSLDGVDAVLVDFDDDGRTMHAQGRASAFRHERKGAANGPFRVKQRALQALKDDPHPQVVVAFGFLITNCAPWRSSL